jgi:hypothetical protein
MSTIQLIFAVAFVGGCSGSTPETPVEPPPEPPAAEKYSVKIHRPLTKGQVLAVDVEAHQTSGAAVKDGEEKQVVAVVEQIDFHLVGEVSIDEVSPDGRAAAATLKVTSFVHSGTKEEILPAGSVVNAKRAEGGVLEPVLEGGTLTDDQKRLLQVAFPLERPGTRLGDELFGTPEPRAVGESWPFNRAYVVEDLREDGYGASENNVDGTVKLTEVVPCGKTQCLRLAIDVKAANTMLLTAKDASDVGSGELVSTILLEVPVDETTPVHLEEAKTALLFEATFTAGDQASKRMVGVDRHRRATYVPVESGAATADAQE